MREASRLMAAVLMLGAGSVRGGVPARGPDELIPRAQLLAYPDRSRPELSPDGRLIAFLAPVEGVPNVWVGPVEEPLAARPATSERSRGVRRYLWSFSGARLVYFREAGDGMSWRLVSIDTRTGKSIDLTPYDGIQPSLFGVSCARPDEVVVGMNNRLPEVRDLYRVSLIDGRAELVRTGSPAVAGWVLDNALSPRYGVSYRPDGGQSLLRVLEGGVGETAVDFPPEDALTSWPVGFADDNRTLFLADSRGRQTSALVSLDTGTGAVTVLARDEACDLEEACVSPRSGRADAASFRRLRRRWVAVDPALEPDMTYLAGIADGEMEVLSRSLDDTRWLVQFSDDDGPDRTVLYERGPTPRARLLFLSADHLAGLPLAPMHALVITARDGLEMPSYLTLPRWETPEEGCKPASPLPMVLLVHGGPWARDAWGFNSVHQLLANRGYAVLSVNFRGSTGFGKDFVNASTGEWGGAMQTDLLDAADWAEREGIAAPGRVAIMGGSYGGYAALRALTSTPTRFACGVELCGPPSVLTLLRSVPPDRRAAAALFRSRVGDPDEPQGRSRLRAMSPLTHAEEIVRPLLAVHGGKDPWSKPSEVERLLDAAQANGAPVTYALFPDEGHSLARPENVAAYFALVEAFLAGPLGGRAEPIAEALTASSAEVRRGGETVGLPPD